MTQHQPEASKSKHSMADDIGKPGITPSLSTTPGEPLGLKRRHFMGTALALDAAALLAACGGGGGGGDAAAGSGSGSGSGSSSGSGSAAPTNWVVSTLAGTGATTPFTDGTGGTATFNGPYGVAVDSSGYLYVADTSNHRIRQITSAGVVSTFAGIGTAGAVNGTVGTAQFNTPVGVALDNSGNLYVAERGNHLIRKINSAGEVSTFAGVGGMSGYMDGTGTTAKFNNPYGIAVDKSGFVYVADSSNNMIRKISPAGVVSSLAGVGLMTGYLDGAGTTATFNFPTAIAVDTSDNLYVADYNSHLIRMINPMGEVSTLAGVAATFGYLDGTGKTANFFFPSGVAVDSTGHVYVVEASNHKVRKITSAGVVSTLAGAGGAGYIEGTAGTAKFSTPYGVALDSSGTFYVTDYNNQRIRKITPI